MFEIHEGLPCDLNVEILCGHETLFQNIPVWGDGFVAINGVPCWSTTHDTDDSSVAMENGNGRENNFVVEGFWEVVKES